MNREKIVRWALILLVPVILFIWGQNFGWFRKKPPGEAADAGAAGGEGAETAVIERQGRRTEYQDWGLDPFRIAQAGPESLYLNLEGVVMDPVSPFAIINGEIRKEGDEIGGATVVLIQPSKVILKRGDQEIVLQLFQEGEGQV